jgi:hypothetical protein
VGLLDNEWLCHMCLSLTLCVCWCSWCWVLTWVNACARCTAAYGASWTQQQHSWDTAVIQNLGDPMCSRYGCQHVAAAAVQQQPSLTSRKIFQVQACTKHVSAGTHCGPPQECPNRGKEGRRGVATLGAPMGLIDIPSTAQNQHRK